MIAVNSLGSVVIMVQDLICEPSGLFHESQRPANANGLRFFIHMKDRKPFAFAGLWDSWNSPEGSQIKSCTIITTEPNELTAIIHNRMPVILHPKDYAKWLDPAPQTPDQLKPLIKPFPDRKSVV